MSAKKTQPNKEKGLLAYIGLGLSYGLFAFVLLIGVAAVIVPLVAGATPLTVLTPSMSPAYPPGTLVIIKPTDVEDIRIGDPITFQIKSGRPEVVTHRVIGIGHNAVGDLSFVTKGDNNDGIDAEPVKPVQIQGTVWYSIPYLGYLNTLMNGNNRAIIVPVLAVGLLLYAGYAFMSSIVGKKRKKTAAEGEATAAAAAPAASATPDDDFAQRERDLERRERELELSRRERELELRERELLAKSSTVDDAAPLSTTTSSTRDE